MSKAARDAAARLWLLQYEAQLRAESCQPGAQLRAKCDLGRAANRPQSGAARAQLTHNLANGRRRCMVPPVA